MIRAALVTMLMTGAAGATPVPAPVSIDGPPGTTCEVTLAHWYVLRFPPSSDGTLSVPLRFDPGGETVSILSRQGIEMAVEGLLCGPEADLHSSGQRLDFRRLARLARGGSPVTCHIDGSDTDCGTGTAAAGP
ncbi:hypothetical protein [Frigidibacter mobilis]|uniref:Membrane-bound lysozyme-inhibitor of c-type lysozyme n=1 Tax=Frigidibacter mobilis TaxID=1335048 RepID=A0A159Z7I4_9RHOB|nr:hypothetical protein [Frigidibacter mobilis]AMY70484.1 hypothetical protein AKL17_3252 [Frigidibacter mobilis]